MFGKHPNELAPADLQRVVSEEVQEGSTLELKGALPVKKNTVDPCMSGQNQIGDYARNELVAEVIAFANAYGGWLLLGVEETSAKPARASAVAPVRDCVELADRLRLQCRDCIEPKLPAVEVAGVPMHHDGAGVVVFHVPRSRMAPHRHVQTRECYIRRADRKEKMSMRETQDLTLQVERGLAEIGRRFSERQEQFARMWDRSTANIPKAFALRTTLVPLAPLYIERVHNNRAVLPPSHPVCVTEKKGDIRFYLLLLCREEPGGR